MFIGFLSYPLSSARARSMPRLPPRPCHAQLPEAELERAAIQPTRTNSFPAHTQPGTAHPHSRPRQIRPSRTSKITRTSCCPTQTNPRPVDAAGDARPNPTAAIGATNPTCRTAKRSRGACARARANPRGAGGQGASRGAITRHAGRQPRTDRGQREAGTCPICARTRRPASRGAMRSPGTWPLAIARPGGHRADLAVAGAARRAASCRGVARPSVTMH